MRKQYWAVKWGDTIRISERTSDVITACRYCYGMTAKDMLVSPLGTNKQAVRRAIRDGLEKRTDWVSAVGLAIRQM